jgi:hypothetical protein
MDTIASEYLNRIRDRTEGKIDRRRRVRQRSVPSVSQRDLKVAYFTGAQPRDSLLFYSPQRWTPYS